MQKLIFLLTTLAALNIQAQNIEIKGTVYDDSGNKISGVTIMEIGTTNGTISDPNGYYTLKVKDEKSKISYTFIGFESQEIKVGKKRKIDVVLQTSVEQLQEVVVEDAEFAIPVKERLAGSVAGVQIRGQSSLKRYSPMMSYEQNPNHNTESYDAIDENIFHSSQDNPLSTFSIDVDAASYSNMRRFLNMGTMPPKDAVRIEEMINYFQYDYENPTGNDPFGIHTSKIKAPWNEDHLLVKIGIQGKKLEMDQLPPSNVVFLLDVSGSMNAPNKLPLLKSSIKMLANELRAADKISIVVYAGAAGLALPPTDGNDKKAILR